MPSYTLREPHPTVPQNSYTHSGRGGAGNFFRAPATTAPSGVPSSFPAAAPPSSASATTSTSSPSSRSFYSGRGGAGNAHAAAQRPTLSFDEECALADARERRASAAGHVGRGGAGNVYALAAEAAAAKKSSRAQGADAVRRDSDATSTSSRGGDDAGSLRSGFWGRISGQSLHH